MKVLIAIPCLLTGGTEVQTLSLARALRQGGHEVVVACYFEHTPSMVALFEAAGARVALLSPFGNRPVGVRATIRAIWEGLEKVVKAERPDVAHVQYMAPGAIPVVLLRLLGIKTVLATLHTSADVYSSLRLLKLLQRRLLRAVQCITQRAEESFFGTAHPYTPLLPLPRGAHFTIYNALPAAVPIAPAPRRAPQDGEVTFGVVSRLEPIKGMDLVIPAFARTLKELPAARLRVTGDGSLRADMEKQAAQLGVSARVTFTGRVDAEGLREAYDAIDVLLMPSRSEGFGLTAIEGMARGCPVVAARVGGLPEVLQEGACGILHIPDDTADLARHMVEAAAPDTFARLSEASLLRAADFTHDRYAEAINSLYSRLLDNPQ